MQFSSSKRRLVFIVALLFFVFSLNLVRNQIRDFFYSRSLPALSLFAKAGNNVSDFFSGGKLKRQNEQLYLENLALQAQLAEFQDMAKENSELRSAFDLDVKKDFEFTGAEIVGRDFVKGSILISKGRSSGISKGMAVITSSKALVGRIDEVFENISRVQLVSHEDSSFDAKIAGKGIQGLAKGMGRGKILFDLIPKEKNLLAGDMVLTASFGEIFPENLLVGKIQNIEKKDVNDFQSAILQTMFQIGSSDLVFIIQRLQ